jgi:hypothetical protein
VATERVVAGGKNGGRAGEDHGSRAASAPWSIVVSTGDEPYADRKKLTFEQAEGAAPLPSQLKLKEISQEIEGNALERDLQTLRRC